MTTERNGPNFGLHNAYNPELTDYQKCEVLKNEV